MTARIGYYIIVLPLSYLPLRALYILTDIFYLLLITCVPYRKAVIQGNIDRSFPMKSEKEKTKIRRQFYRHFTDLLAEGVKNLSISKKEQSKRFSEIKSDPLKQWKMTKLDEKAQDLWEDYTEYKNAMFQKTNTEISPWKIIRANRKTDARVNVINHILDRIPYDKKLEI